MSENCPDLESHCRISEVSYNTMHNILNITLTCIMKINITGIDDSSESEDESQDLQGI